MEIIKGSFKSGTTSPAPDIECWIPDNNTDRIGLIIFPGGGYGGLAAHEGRGYAEYFCSKGIACFVVSYRLGSNGFRHPAMIEDALASIETIRSNADQYGIDPARIGIMGSSAGGHLAAHTIVACHKYHSEVSLRPDFAVLCYPVILSEGAFINKGSIKNLAGSDPSPDLLKELSCDKHVSEDTSPCFIWHTDEDQGVPLENSMSFVSALRAAGVPFEFHVYTKGRHGLGLGTDFRWEIDCLRWIKETVCPEGDGVAETEGARVSG